MIRSAILRTEKVVAARLGWAEPHGVVMSRNNVHFHAERGNVEIVNDVLAGEGQAHIAAHGNVQFIDFFQAVGLLRFPHPLLGDDINVERVLRRVAIIQAASSRASPWIGTPTASASLRWYLKKKKTMATVMATANKKHTALIKSIRASTCGAKLDACSGYNGNCDCTA